MDMQEKLCHQKSALIRAINTVQTPADLTVLLARLEAGEANDIMVEQATAERDKYQLVMDELGQE